MRGGGRQGRLPGFNAYVGSRTQKERDREKEGDRSFKERKKINREKVQL